MNRLTDRVALITGASRGIGHTMALHFAAEGAHLAVNYLNHKAEADALVAEVSGNGQRAVAVQGDVTQEDQVRHMVQTTIRSLGRIDILVANAGITRDQLVAGMSLDDWEQVIQTNLRGPFLCIREIVPHMMRQRSGSIVNISSVAADHAGRGHANYAAAKGGVNALTRSLAVELAPRGIRVNAVAPGIILTDMTKRVRNLAADEILAQIPLGRFGDPEDVARAACFLASDDARYITGQVLHVSGGLGL